MISKMPDTLEIDDSMYRIFALDKVRKAREAVKKCEIMTVEELQKEIDGKKVF